MPTIFATLLILMIIFIIPGMPVCVRQLLNQIILSGVTLSSLNFEIL